MTDIENLKREFCARFGLRENIEVYTAPGRVNLIGEHVDYCGGPVLPAALTVGTTLLAAKRDDNILRLMATDLDVTVEAPLDNLENFKGKLGWGEYTLGVASEMLKAGFEFGGYDMLYRDTVPHGAGLSSSAAVELATALCFASGAGADITSPAVLKELAVLSQKAEHNFMGVNCGIMDQFASALGKKDNCIFLNCSTLDYEYVPLELGDCSLVIANSNKKHALGDSKYNERRAECAEALRTLKKVMPDIDCLADVSSEDVVRYSSLFENSTVKNRALHVTSECERVRKFVEALKKGDLSLAGKLMNESHNSLRDNFEVSCPELDILVSAAREYPGVKGSRMIGGGFGGSTLSVVRNSQIEGFISDVGSKYHRETNLKADFYISEIGPGASSQCAS